ncbi:hypothetical protein Cni_G13204 [Canna indica]|uniref:Uncharacterized protein n=1 Tax=Canna indica TaxID=4628 RepID=A0AAQ3QCW6_9LILI|nr:hypothetical protein Cni_G13204 [Canna indica]
MSSHLVRSRLLPLLAKRRIGRKDISLSTTPAKEPIASSTASVNDQTPSPPSPPPPPPPPSLFLRCHSPILENPQVAVDILHSSNSSKDEGNVTIGMSLASSKPCFLPKVGDKRLAKTDTKFQFSVNHDFYDGLFATALWRSQMRRLCDFDKKSLAPAELEFVKRFELFDIWQAYSAPDFNWRVLEKWSPKTTINIDLYAICNTIVSEVGTVRDLDKEKGQSRNRAVVEAEQGKEREPIQILKTWLKELERKSHSMSNELVEKVNLSLVSSYLLAINSILSGYRIPMVSFSY